MLFASLNDFFRGCEMQNNAAHEVARLIRTPGLLGTVNDLARFMNLTPRRIQQLAKEGIIEKDRPGGYDIIRCLSMYIAYLAEWRSAAELPCTIEGLAFYFGLTRGQVAYLIRRGILPPPISHGRFDLASAIKAFSAHVHRQGFVGTYRQRPLEFAPEDRPASEAKRTGPKKDGHG